MNIEIRLGTRKDIDALEMLYNDLNDYLESTTNYPGWKKGVYPTRQDAVAGVEEGCLYVAAQNDEIVGSMILRHKQEPAYSNAVWQAPFKESEVLVVYTFTVNPNYLQHGIGKKMLDFACQYGSSQNVKALRLDVYENNIPAIELYKKCGFHYIGTVSLGLEASGLNWFQLFEKLL